MITGLVLIIGSDIGAVVEMFTVRFRDVRHPWDEFRSRDGVEESCVVGHIAGSDTNLSSTIILDRL